ncbi:hypothetical protein FGG08_005816 [Glutinoglossum americanum]|uniref:BTB domain-containing protein n=1 Tax=Glutinoglossum americanum TaxID=1670608 RepID=A0A9P8HXP3_9PEZI|nr:hypothetical protein FGG08_005816 [Glutinoglossum americanum]
MKRSGDPVDSFPTGKKTRSRKIDEFPVFSKGTVEIKLSEDPAYQYQLHRAVLDRSSIWFLESIGQPFVESGPTPKSGRILYRYILLALKDTDEPLLTRVSLAASPALKPTNAENHIAVIKPDPGVFPEAIISGEVTNTSSNADTALSKTKRERSSSSVILIDSIEPTGTPLRSAVKRNAVELETETFDRAKKAYQCRLEAYNNLFLTFYNIAPQIATSDISRALTQCDALVRLAELYDCLNIVRPYLSNVLLQYRGDLYKAIAKDPPRWLLISIPIQSGPIFAEAAIHCIGCWPEWPWTTHWGCLTHNVLVLIRDKASDLRRSRAETESNLFVNTIRVEGRGCSLAGKTPRYDTWMVVSVFRAWLASVIQSNRENNREHLPSYFRKMRKAGEAYLPLETVETMLKPYSGPNWGQWDEIMEDLKLVKEFAEAEVCRITKNNLMLDVEEAKVQYLTCANIEPDEYPWVEQAAPETGI